MLFNNQKIYHDYVESMIKSAFALRSVELVHIEREYEYKFFDKHIHSLKNLNPAVEEVEKALREQLSEVEFELKETISSHSILWWTILESRLPYLTNYSSNKATIGLSRLTLRIAILKYGLIQPDDIEYQETQVIPKDLSVDDIVSLLKIDKLAFIAYMTTADLRNLWKGGILRFEEGIKEYGWNHPEETKEAILWMDRRSETSGSNFFTTGIFVTLNLADIQKKISIDFPPWNLIALPNYNLKIQWKDLPYIKGFDDIPEIVAPNLLFLPLDFESIDSSIKPFSNFFSKAYGFTTTQIINVLILLAYRLKKVIDTNPSMILQVSKRGYIPIRNRDILIEDILHFWEIMAEESKVFSSTPKELRKNVVERILSKFVVNVSNQNRNLDFDILSRHPSPWLIEIENKTILMDLRNVAHALDDFFYNAIVNCDESTANEIRNLFPHLCWTEISQNSSRVKKMWNTNRVISVNGVKRECDLSFIVDDVLFICECKARRTNFKKFVGEKGAMVNQWKDSIDDLNSVISLAEFILNNKNEQSINIPKKVNFIVPLIIYPDVTWIPQKKPPYLIGKRIPRFITPQELRKEIRTDLKFFKRDELTLKLSEEKKEITKSKGEYV